MAADRVWLCGGSDCRKRRNAWRKLQDALSGCADVTVVPCQSICKGPVFGTRIDGRREWFRKVRGRALRSAAVRLLEEGDLDDELASHRVRKRSGKLKR